jgi:hypothetical protein
MINAWRAKIIRVEKGSLERLLELDMAEVEDQSSGKVGFLWLHIVSVKALKSSANG